MSRVDSSNGAGRRKRPAGRKDTQRTGPILGKFGTSVFLFIYIFVLPQILPAVLFWIGKIDAGELRIDSAVIAIVGQIPLFILLFPADWWRRSPAGQPDTLINRLLGKRLRISLRFLAFRTYLLLLALFLLSTYGLIIFIWVPFLLFFFVLFQLLLRPLATRRALRFPLPGVVLICIAALVVAAGAVAPFRAVLTATLFLLGERGGETLQFFSGYDSGARFDLWLGIGGVLAAFLWTLLDAFWRLRQARQVENLPTSTVRAAAVGLVELKGRARLLSKDKKEDAEDAIILSLAWDSRSYLEPQQSLKPFLLDDGTGSILIDPRGCRVRAGWITDIASISLVREIVLTRRMKYFDLDDAVVMTLRDGDEVYVAGNAELKKGASTAGMGPDRLVVRPSAQPTLDASLWRIFFGERRLPEGRGMFNVFFLSDTTEQGAKQRIMRGFRTVWLLGFLWFCSSLWLAGAAQHRLENFVVVEQHHPIPGGYHLKTFYKHRQDVHPGEIIKQ